MLGGYPLAYFMPLKDILKMARNIYYQTMFGHNSIEKTKDLQK
jgi:hypothetical protein